MFLRLIEKLDNAIGLNAHSDPECVLLRERFAALTRQLPWLYTILFANIVGFHLALKNESDISNIPPAILVVIVGIRGIRWFRLRSMDVPDTIIRREMRGSLLATLFFCVGACAWCMKLSSTLAVQQRVDVTMFASLAAIGFGYGMSSFPAAARIPLLTLVLPLAVLLAATAGPSQFGLGISLIILAVLTVRLLAVQDNVFKGLVASRLATEAEKQRALAAEMTAVAEQSRVKVIANTDSLTGLTNRRGFLSAIDKLAVAGKRGWALILLDLDGFKPINDTYGHASGDAILVEVSRRLQRLFGRRGAVSRLGGDEFAIIRRCDSDAEAQAIANQAVESLSAPFLLSGRRMTLSACAGVSCARGVELAHAIHCADIALYEAKRRERGSVALFCDEMEQQVQRRTTIEQALCAPGLANEVDLAFQPIFHLGTMELRSFEALARWHHSELGWIPPSEFIPITEQISVVHQLTEILLRRAAAAARTWPDSVRLSFNLSCVQLCSPGIAARVLAIINEEGMRPDRLQIEVTETALLGDFELARGNLSGLRHAGVRIVLDDFGAGYASISYLREMRFDAIKLDGSLISSITDGGSGLPLLQGVLALCQAMGLPCVAEHIETQNQLRLLRRLGCRYGQGYLLARPLDSAGAERLANGPALLRAANG